jgi:hypothetical protein
VDATWVESRCPPMDLVAPLRPDFLLELGQHVGCEPSSVRLVFCAGGASASLPVRRTGLRDG